jgi:hypothetical protein
MYNNIDEINEQREKEEKKRNASVTNQSTTDEFKKNARETQRLEIDEKGKATPIVQKRKIQIAKPGSGKKTRVIGEDGSVLYELEPGSEKEKAMMERRKYKGSEEDKKDLQEAIRTIKTLRGQLNEVNLLNAKLIYVNKLFKAHNLTEGQKVNIVNSFDKAATLNEAKNVFEILKSTISKSAPKASLKESKSFASSVIGGRPAAKPIINEDETISRMQRLAGIK